MPLHRSPPDAPPPRLEVRLLGGPVVVARCVVELAASAAATLGAGWDNAVVLRHAGLGDGRIAVDHCTPDGVGLRVLEGPVRLGAQDRSTGDTLVHPLYTPLEVGCAQVMFGVPGSPEWDCPAPVSHTTPPRSALRRWGRWTAGLGVSVAGLLVVALGQSTAASAVAQAASATSPRNAAAWQALLDAEGFARVSAEADRQGTWHLGGHVDTADQRGRLEQFAGAQGVAVQVDAWVNEALAAALQEVLRVQGVPAEARVEERGRAHVTTHLADASRLAALKAVLLRDVPGVSDVVLDNVATAGQHAPASPHVDDPGKRVSSVVPGDPPYVVTADGTRYFEGALLPTGQRVVSIREGEVVLSDVSGGTATLRF